MLPEIFSSFEWFSGPVRHRFYPSPIGAMMDQRFNYDDHELSHIPHEGTWHFERCLPAIDDEIFEWIDILETVKAARGHYRIIELGAGYGRWMVNAALAARQRSIPFHLIGVEAEPAHFAWMERYLRDNDIDPDQHTLVRAPVSGSLDVVRFYTGKPNKWYGQAITRDAAPQEEGLTIVEMQPVTLSAILAPLGIVDLIDMDVQGAEYEVLEAAQARLRDKVRRIHIGTHSAEIEANLFRLFSQLDWRNTVNYPCGQTSDTPYGRITFGDGVQTWINPVLG